MANERVQCANVRVLHVRALAPVKTGPTATATATATAATAAPALPAIPVERRPPPDGIGARLRRTARPRRRQAAATEAAALYRGRTEEAGRTVAAPRRLEQTA